MIKEEYKRLLELIESCQEAEKVTLEDILKEAVVFFETLRKEFPKASKEDREEMIEMMTHLHARLQDVSKETAEASGMTEEELSSFAENPSNFTPEQWQMVQASRRQLYDSARKFSSTLGKEGEKAKGTEGQAPKKKPIRSKARRTKRKDWRPS